MEQVVRPDGRKYDELRPIEFNRNYTKYAEGSVLVKAGETLILCNASVENKVPPFLRGAGQGWVTAEYSLLPRSTNQRVVREIAKGRPSGRTQEIQRLIGRALRSVVDLKGLGENTIWVDCDVIQADGGTRTAALSGAFVALVDAVNFMVEKNLIKQSPLRSYLAATSVGIVDGEKLLDLSFAEDSRAQVDLNLVMTDQEEIVEIQGTAEGDPFSLDDFEQMMFLGQLGIQEIIDMQKKSLENLAAFVRPDNG